MSGTTGIQYVDADFRTMFPYFGNMITWPANLLQMYFTMATGFVNNNPNWAIDTASQTVALYLMTAHLAAVYAFVSANSGSAPNIETSAQIDKIRVTVQPPKSATAFQQWLNQTPFGQQLLALLLVKSAGGFYSGGRREIGAFRRSGGLFG